MRNEPTDRQAGTLTAVLNDERGWLVAALVAGGVVVAGYYATNPYPAYATALFLHMAEILIENGYRRPETVPLYTADGIPFAYPPLMFYALALLIDLGIDPIHLARLLPGLLYVCALIPYFYLSREFLPVRQAGLATVAVAVTPQLFRWHISGGGTVRAAGFLLVLTGLYVGACLFETENPRLIFPGALLFGLTMLTHPVFAAYFGLSYLVFFAVLSHSLRGLLYGAAVAVGGAVVGAPWWYHVSRMYGPETILGASGTHGGLGAGAENVIGAIGPLHDVLTWWGLLAVVALGGGAYLLWQRQYVIPVWFVATTIVIPQPRFKFIAGMMLIGVLVAGELCPRLAEVVVAERRRDDVLAVAFAALIVTMTWFGGVHAAGAAPEERHDEMPAYVNGDDIEAMEWVANETPDDATFAVLGDQAEWFPYVSDRTSLVGPWGVEWTTPEQYEYHQRVHGELTRCDDAACVSETLDEHEIAADYVYVPKGEYAFGGSVRTQDEGMRTSLVESDRYALAYENDGAMVFRVTDGR
jgi:hypothetical protein